MIQRPNLSGKPETPQKVSGLHLFQTLPVQNKKVADVGSSVRSLVNSESCKRELKNFKQKKFLFKKNLGKKSFYLKKQIQIFFLFHFLKFFKFSKS